MKELEDESLATTTINVFELLYGAKISKKPDENLAETKKILQNLNIFSFDQKSSDEASSILAHLKNIGKIVGIKDVMIAGICRSNKLDLITKNIDHFKNMNDLNYEKY